MMNKRSKICAKYCTFPAASKNLISNFIHFLKILAYQVQEWWCALVCHQMGSTKKITNHPLCNKCVWFKTKEWFFRNVACLRKHCKRIWINIIFWKSTGTNINILILKGDGFCRNAAHQISEKTNPLPNWAVQIPSASPSVNVSSNKSM